MNFEHELSTQFNTRGFVLVLCASFVGGICWTVMQILMQKAELVMWGVRKCGVVLVTGRGLRRWSPLLQKQSILCKGQGLPVDG